MSFLTGVPWRWLAWFWLPSLAICFRTSTEAAALGWTDDRYNYTLVLPLIAIILLYQERDLIGEALQNERLGLAVFGAGIAANLVLTHLTGGVDLFWRMLALAIAWSGGLLYCHGWAGLRNAAFPCLLLLATPAVPDAWMRSFEVGLQHASADGADLLFQMLGTTVYREGLVFSLPGLNVEVARECSGIRSTTALIVVVAVTGHLLLRRAWAQLIYVLLAIPVGIFKNSVRITTLAWLGSNVSPEYLTGWLHKHGGPPFTMVALAILVPSLFLLQRLERNRRGVEA